MTRQWGLPGICLGLVALASWFLQGSAFGVPACPEPAQVRQPDGSLITVVLRGDEHVHWYEDQRGYLIKRSAAGGPWVYARQVDGRVVVTEHVVGQADPAELGLARPDLSQFAAQAADQRAAATAAAVPGGAGQQLTTSITKQNLVVLVDFSDLTISYDPNDYDALFNQIGYSDDGAAGSVKDYYLEISYDGVTIESTIVGPVTLDHAYAYYGGNDASGDDLRPEQMVSEALAKLEDANFDFAPFDGDGDGWIDGLDIIHAGGGEEYSGNDANYIWSHMSVFGFVNYDGVSMALYHTEPARRGWDSNPSTWGVTRIGVICHETGHFFGLPDLYDYGGDSRGCGDFCLMAGGSWNGNYGTRPAHVGAWCKVALGLVTPTVITSPGTYVINQVETNTQIYKLQGSWPANEYFLIENRQGVGFDAGLPGSSRGLLVWHIDDSQPNNNNQNHYKVDVEEASGTQHLQLNLNDGQDSDYYRLGNVTTFAHDTTPDNKSYAGELLGMNVINVSATGSSMSFDVVGPFALTVDAVNGGLGTIEYSPEPNDPNAPTYPAGQDVSLTAIPNPDRYFSHWLVYDPNHPSDANYAAVDTNSTLALIMDADRQVTAVFRCSDNSVPPLSGGVLLILLTVRMIRRQGSIR